MIINDRLVFDLKHQTQNKLDDSWLPVRYEVNCFGPQRMGNRAVVLMVFWDCCDPSLGMKCVPLEDSPHQRSLTNVVDGGLWTVHSTRLNVTRRKHLSWPSTRGGRLVEGDTSLGTRDISDYGKVNTQTQSNHETGLNWISAGIITRIFFIMPNSD